jgi:chromosome segregation ATPase
LTTTSAVLSATLEVETAARTAAELQATNLLARIDELEAVEESLRSHLAAERATSADAVTAAEALRAELTGLRARDQTEAAAVVAADQQLAATRDQLAVALADAEALRAQIVSEQSSSEQVGTTVETLRAELQEVQSRQVADSAAALAAEQTLGAMRDQLAVALADAETLRAVIAIDHAAREKAEAAATALRAQVDELQAQDAAESRARSSAEEQLETTRRELESALARAETSSRELEAERHGNAEAAAVADELRARVTDLETELRKARVSVVPPVQDEIDELRAVIELQEQALAAADARERRRPSAVSDSTRSYAHEAHLLFALNAEGYELLERSGPAPAVGSTVELSKGRICRVLRVGPSPFPGGQEACAYLEPA